jgi:glutathione S-transferase
MVEDDMWESKTSFRVCSRHVMLVCWPISIESPTVWVERDNFTLEGVHAIVRYLAQRSAPDWYSTDPECVARIDGILDWHARVLHVAVSHAIHAQLFPALFDLTPGDPAQVELVAEGTVELTHCLDFLETCLATSKQQPASSHTRSSTLPVFACLCGDRPTIADLTVATNLVAWDALNPSEVQRRYLGTHPLVATWLECMRTKIPKWDQVHEVHAKFAQEKRVEHSKSP